MILDASMQQVHDTSSYCCRANGIPLFVKIKKCRITFISDQHDVQLSSSGSGNISWPTELAVSLHTAQPSLLTGGAQGPQARPRGVDQVQSPLLECRLPRCRSMMSS